MYLLFFNSNNIIHKLCYVYIEIKIETLNSSLRENKFGRGREVVVLLLLGLLLVL